MLGYGYPLESLRDGIDSDTAFLGVDGGSSDPGPYYLGTGSGFVKPLQTKRDLEPVLVAARRHDIPFIIGSAGGAGARPHVDDFLSVLLAIAERHDLHFRLAVIPADIDKRVVLKACREGRIAPCGWAPGLTEERIRKSDHIVGQMGMAPIIRALRGGADVVVAGRCCDTAIFASLPVMRGFDPALALHCAKIAECGTLCAEPGAANDSLKAVVRRDHFIVEPANPARRCTPDSVAMHSLYEQPDPGSFVEPEGRIDMSASRFEPCGRRGVRVSGTRFVPADHPTVKLEGVELKGYRAVTIAGIRDPAAIGCLDEIEMRVRDAVGGNLRGTLDRDDYTIRFLRYGMDAVTGPDAATPGPLPREMGLVIEAIAPSQELADTVLSSARSTALHQSFAGRKTTAGNLAFPFSPSDFRGGPVYEFSIYHLMRIESDATLFPVSFTEI